MADFMKEFGGEKKLILDPYILELEFIDLAT